MVIREGRPRHFLDVAHTIPDDLIRKLPSPHLARYAKEGLFRACIDKEYVPRRLREYIHVCQALGRSPAHADLHRKLLDCNKQRPSNLTFSPMCRQNRIERDVTHIADAFGQVENDRLYMMTIIVSVHKASDQNLIQDILGQIAAIRRKLRNHRAEQRQEHRWYETIGMIGYFEIEPYLYRVDAADTDVGGAEPALTKDRMAAKAPLKTALLRNLGWDEACNEDFYVLHLHCVVNLRSCKAFKKRMRCDGMFPHPRQVYIKPFFKTLSKGENIRRVASYMLKVTPRRGRLFKKRNAALLPTGPMLAFLALHSQLTFKQLSFNLGAMR